MAGYDVNALNLRGIAQEMTSGRHKHNLNYELERLNHDLDFFDRKVQWDTNNQKRYNQICGYSGTYAKFMYGK